MFFVFLCGILDLFDVFVLAFLSFRFNKNAIAEQRGDLLEMWRRIEKVMKY